VSDRDHASGEIPPGEPVSEETVPGKTVAGETALGKTDLGETLGEPVSGKMVAGTMASDEWDALVLVGRIARPNGLRGHVAVNPETDFPEERFRVGAELWARNADQVTRLIVEEMRLQGGRPIVRFAGVDGVEDAGALAGTELRIPESALQPLGDGVYYHHQLVGCVVVAAGKNAGDATDRADTADAVVGPVVRVEGGVGGSILVVAGAHGEVLIPLAADICVEVDVGARRIRVEAPEGLLELNETKRSRQLATGQGGDAAPRP
jgi:16S rRNA processing protein RimM